MALATVVAGQRQRQMSCWRCLLVALEKAAVRLQARQRGRLQRRHGGAAQQPIDDAEDGAPPASYRYSEDEAAVRLQARQRGRLQRRRGHGGGAAQAGPDDSGEGVEEGVYDVEELDLDLPLPDEAEGGEGVAPPSPDGAAPGVGGDDPGAFGSTGAFD